MKLVWATQQQTISGDIYNKVANYANEQSVSGSLMAQ